MRSVALLVGVLLLAGCSRPTPKLDALEADPMATVAIPGVEIEREYGHAEGESLGKQVMASYSRTFVVVEGEPSDVVRAVQSLAEDNGWTTDYVDDTSYHAEKMLTVGTPTFQAALLTLAVNDDWSGILRLTQE